MDDAILILQNVVKTYGLNKTAKILNYSPATISLVLKNAYKGDLNSVYRRIKEVFTSETINCPVLGEITKGRCAEERKKGFATTSHIRFRLLKMCEQCELWK